MYKMPMLWFCLALFFTAVLFYTSQKVTEVRSQIAALQKDTAKEVESLRVLEAEWSYLNQPDRLKKLVAKHLGLVPLIARQIVKLKDLDASSIKPVASKFKVKARNKVKIKKTVAPAVSAKALSVKSANRARSRTKSMASVAQKRGFGDVVKSLSKDSSGNKNSGGIQ